MFLLSIDPGWSTGIVLGEYDNETPYQRITRWQITDGIKGFLHWMDEHHGGTGDLWWQNGGTWYYSQEQQNTIVCEKFVPLPAPRSFKLKELEPLRIEGVVEDRFGSVEWQRSSAMVLAGGETQSQRKKNSDDVLRRMGLWSTGKDVGRPDADDVNSAQKHAIAYLRSIGHKPTTEQLIY